MGLIVSCELEHSIRNGANSNACRKIDRPSVEQAQESHGHSPDSLPEVGRELLTGRRSVSLKRYCPRLPKLQNCYRRWANWPETHVGQMLRQFQGSQRGPGLRYYYAYCR